MGIVSAYVKQDDTRPSLRAQLLNRQSDGTLVACDLTTATEVKFKMRSVANADGTLKIDAAMVIETADEGRVRYDWQAADTDTAGRYYGEIQVTFSGGAVETFPNKSFFEVLIGKDL